MELEFDLGLENVDERQLESAGKLPEGWYMARLADAYPDSENPALKLEFEITAGAYAGRKIHDSLWDPQSRTEADDAKRDQQRLLLITGRLGARTEGTGKVNLLLAIGKPFVLQLAKKKHAWCSRCKEKPVGKGLRKCPTCGERLDYKTDEDSFANIAYDGVFPPDHDKLADDVRKQLGITAPRRAVAGATAAAATQATTQTAAAVAQPRQTVRPSTPPPAAPAMSRQDRLTAAMTDL